MAPSLVTLGITAGLTHAQIGRMRSQLVKEGPERSPNRSMLRAIGYTDDDFKKAEGSVDKLYGIIQARFGDTKEAIKAKLDKLHL